MTRSANLKFNLILLILSRNPLPLIRLDNQITFRFAGMYSQTNACTHTPSHHHANCETDWRRSLERNPTNGKQHARSPNDTAARLITIITRRLDLDRRHNAMAAARAELVASRIGGID